jgi:hypothetical protein
MRKVAYLFSVLMFFWVAVHAQQMKSEPETWDFGKIKEGEIVRHDFVLKNGTDKDLKIEGVTTSCGCTASAVKHKLLKPGESTEIEVSFNSSKYSGAVKQHIYVNTDSVDNPLMQFIIKADVVKQK